jgi:hypothetical protein
MVCSKCDKDNELMSRRKVCRKCYNAQKVEQRKKQNIPEREGECTKCFQVKTLLKGKRWCKDCKNEYEKNRRSKNLEAHNKREREYYQKKKENLKEFVVDITKSKICGQCKKEKTLDMFYVAKTQGRIRSECKECSLKAKKENYYKNREARIKQTTQYQNNKRKTDPLFRLEKNMRSRLYHALRSQKADKTNRTFKLVGCTIQFLKGYLQSKFTEGMTWEKYGQGFHIDHIKPCCSFDLTKEEEQKKCFHYTNLQPLWAEDNMKKGGKY